MNFWRQPQRIIGSQKAEHVFLMMMGLMVSLFATWNLSPEMQGVVLTECLRKQMHVQPISDIKRGNLVAVAGTLVTDVTNSGAPAEQIREAFAKVQNANVEHAEPLETHILDILRCALTAVGEVRRPEERTVFRILATFDLGSLITSLLKGKCLSKKESLYFPRAREMIREMNIEL
jgi:hypothetical protein